MTGEEYMALLLQRQEEASGAHPWAGRPLLEAMVRPGDEDLFTPPPTPRRAAATTPAARHPRRTITAAELRERRDRLLARQEHLAAPLLPEAAAAHGLALGARRTARVQARQDRRLEQWAVLQRSVEGLTLRIRRVEAHELRHGTQTDPMPSAGLS